MFLYTLSLHAQETNKNKVCHKYTSFCLAMIKYFSKTVSTLAIVADRSDVLLSLSHGANKC